LLAASPAFADAGSAGLTAYVRARAAAAAGAVDVAAQGYAAALAARPNDPDVALRAWRGALAAGDETLADRAAKVLEASNKAPIDVGLYRLAEAARSGDDRRLDAALTGLKGSPLALLGPPVEAWRALAAGKDPFAPIDQAKGDAMVQRYGAETRALLLIGTGRTEEGLALLHALLGNDQASIELRYDAAQLLAGKGHADEARALLTDGSPLLDALAAKLGNGVQPSLGFGVSRLLTRLAADLHDGKAPELSIAITRAALIAEPGNDRVRLFLAEALAADGATDEALAALDAIKPGQALHDVAQDERIVVLQAANRGEAALAAAKARSAAPDADIDDARTLGNALTALKRYDEAANAYALALRRAGRDADWTYHLQLGGALEQAGHWPQARAELELAVKIAPDQPLALNYLGYASLEHGGDAQTSLRLLEQAHALAPTNASIADSLGWAWFKQGDAVKAAPLLESAVAADPANATISEHLGDVYWLQGRRYEARYAWAAAQALGDPADRPRLAAKIANGPSPRNTAKE
jgi:Flp pilus assembly protein TadD